MPTKIKERERDPDAPKPKEKHRHRSSRSTHKSKKASTPPEQSSSTTSPTTKRRASVPESKSDRVTPIDSPLASKTSLPYPSFSKEHSKEAVGSRENVVKPRLNFYTPDPTDLEQGKKQVGKEEKRKNATFAAPPSPPETSLEDKAKMDDRKSDAVKGERRRTDLQKAADELKRRLTKSSSSVEMGKDRKSETARSRPSRRESTREEGKSAPASARNSKPGTPSKLRPKAVTVEDSSSATSYRKTSSSVQSSSSKSEAPTISTDSDATSIAPDQPTTQRPSTPMVVMADRVSSSTLDADSEPKTPTASEPHPTPSRKETPALSFNGRPATADIFEESPMPPPPPPAPDVSAPRVDYLLRNGGLSQEVPRGLLGAGQPLQPDMSVQPVANPVDTFFAPFNGILEDYMKVMSRNGSIAVATGYRSVARRLLDRLEAVFARDISSETCTCTLCQSSPTYGQESEERQGVSWGEILEYVCGRQELPQWPPFQFDNFGLGITSTEQAPPMQKLDIDVPEEFRAHYIRQSRKTKQSVDRWLDSQPANPTSPPQEVDDETLTFAMLTRLEPHQRPLFKSLLGVAPTRPASAAPVTNAPTPQPPLLSSDPTALLPKTGLAIQRLYRIPQPPRDPESALYLLTNPSLHNMLATLAAVSDQEWDILISGRFDGFLRSGADEPTPAPLPPPSRGPTPLVARTPQQSRATATPAATSSPATAGAPVALDEETEIAILAEVEREIYLGMEALEDAFENLHQKAENVRSALRERGAGLAQASQRRRCGSLSSTLDARMGTPASVLGGWGAGGGGNGWESGTDDGGGGGGEDWDVESLAPDDSASNVSRTRRPRRRVERRTPALVEEEDEEEEEEGDGGGGGRRGGRRRG